MIEEQNNNRVGGKRSSFLPTSFSDLSHHHACGSARGGSLLWMPFEYFERHFHDIIFNHPFVGLRSFIPFGFRPISLKAAQYFCLGFMHSFQQTVVFSAVV